MPASKIDSLLNLPISTPSPLSEKSTQNILFIFLKSTNILSALAFFEL